MQGHFYAVAVSGTNPQALEPMWVTKIGSARPMILGAYIDDVLVAVDAPELAIRRPGETSATTQLFELDAHEDADGVYNLVRAWTVEELAGLGAGRFIAEVRGTVGGGAVVLPDSGYIIVRILGGLV